MAKIKAHPRVANPKQQQRLQRRSRTTRSPIRCYSSSSESGSESITGDETRKINNQMDSLALIGGGSSTEKQKPKMSTAPRGQLAAVAPNPSKRRQNLSDASQVRSFSVLMGLDVNEEEWAKSKQQSHELVAHRPRRSNNNKVAPTRSSRPKKPVGDSLAGSLMASLSLSENEGVRPKTTKQLQRSKRPHRGFSSSLLVTAARDADDDDSIPVAQTSKQQHPPRGHALRRAYAAAGKQMRPPNRCRLGNKHPRGRPTRSSTSRDIPKGSTTSALEAAVGVLKEDPSKKPNHQPSRSILAHHQSAKPKTNKPSHFGSEKRVAFAGEVKAGPSMLEVLVAPENANDVESNRLLESPSGKSKNGIVKQQNDKQKRVTFVGQMKASQSKGFANGNAGGLLSLFGDEVHTTDESAQKSAAASTTKVMSILSPGSIGLLEAATPLRMDCVASPSPLKKSDQKSLVDCLELCHIEERHNTDNSSRKRMEVASPELKVNRKRRDQKKTPGKKEADSSTAVVDDQQLSQLSAAKDFSEKASQSPMQEQKKTSKHCNNKSRGSKHMIVDLENSVSDLSDDEVFGNSPQPLLDSSPALSVCAENQAGETCETAAPLQDCTETDKADVLSSASHALQSTHSDSPFERAGAAAATMHLSNGILVDGRSAKKSQSSESEETLGDDVRVPPASNQLCSSSLQPSSTSSSISIQSVQNLAPVNDAGPKQPSDNQIQSSDLSCLVASRANPMQDSESPEKAPGGREKFVPESLKVVNQSQNGCQSPQPPHPSPMQIESPLKEIKARDEKTETAAFAARRSRRQRIVTDRFTIAAHTAGGHYVPPHPPVQAAEKKEGRRTKPHSKIAPNSKQEKTKKSAAVEKRADDCIDSGDSSEILFESLDSPQSESVAKENDGMKVTLNIEQRSGKTTEASHSSENGAAGKTQGKMPIQKPWRSRRERKQTDFFHQLDNGNSTENGTPPEKMHMPIDADTLALSGDSVDNSNCGQQQRDEDDDKDISIQRPRRERKKTAFYHNDYSNGDAPDVAESLSEGSEDDQSGGMTCSPSGKEAGIQEEGPSILPVHLGPRRIRRFAGRKPLLTTGKLKACTSSSDDDWSPKELERLSSAMAKVDPTSETFWYTVALLVNDRTESECRSKWFSVAKTPMPKLSKKEARQQNDKEHSDDEDDIFNSSPMRGFLLPDNGIQDSATVFIDENVGSAIKVKGKTSGNTAGSISTNMSSFRPRVGYKMYLQNLRRDVSRAEKADAGRKVAAKTKGPRAISEAVYDADVDVNARLTPGGTLKVKSQFEDEEDDFWAADYDGGDEEEMYE